TSFITAPGLNTAAIPGWRNGLLDDLPQKQYREPSSPYASRRRVHLGQAHRIGLVMADPFPAELAVFVGPWDTEEYELQPGTAILARRPETGACVYLDRQTGCTIYDRRPKACRAFSCKIFVENKFEA